MKIKYIILSLTLLIVGGLITSCIDDKSSLDINDIPGVAVDVTGMETLSVFQFDHLIVNPTVNSIGLSDSDLSYEWKINIQYNDTNYTVIGTEKNLDYEVRLRPNEGSRYYQLVYTVTDITRDLDYITAWATTVKNNLGEGLVIAETVENSKTDLSLIMSTELTTDFDGEKILHHIYSANNNDEYLEGIVKQLHFTTIQNVNSILALTENSIQQIKTFNYIAGGINDDLFFAAKDSYHPQMMASIIQNDIYIGNGQFTPTYLGISPKLGLPYDFSYQLPDHIAIIPTPNPPVVLNFYDEVLEGFVYLPSVMYGDKTMYPTPASTGLAFNPVEVTNKVNLAAATSQTGDFMHLLKDKTTNELALYVFDGGVKQYPSPIPPSPKVFVNLSSAPEIGDAIDFVFMDNQKVMYYATSNKIYAVMFASSNPVFELRYTAPAGEEITTLQVYNQVGYPNGSDYIATNNKQLIMSTYSTEGKVYLLPIINLGAGNIDEANIKTFGGFGKITAIIPQK